MSAEIKYAKCSCGQCGGHIEFPAEYAGNTIACPHCGAGTVLIAPKRRGFRTLAASLLLVVFGAAVGAAIVKFHSAPAAAPTVTAVQRPPPQTPAKPAPPPPPKVWRELEEKGPVKLVNDGNLVYAVGKLRNISDKQKFGVKVTVDLQDSTGVSLGTATDYTAFVDPGKEWSFRALVVDHGVAKVEIKDVTEQ